MQDTVPKMDKKPQGNPELINFLSNIPSHLAKNKKLRYIYSMWIKKYTHKNKAVADTMYNMSENYKEVLLCNTVTHPCNFQTYYCLPPNNLFVYILKHFNFYGMVTKLTV